MSWISRVSLRREGGATRAIVKLLLESAEGDAGHRLVWSLFSGEPEGSRRFLYRRIDEGSFLVVSAHPPKDESGLWIMETKPYEPALEPGSRFGFSLRANPSLRVGTERERSGRGKRADAVMHAKRAARAAGAPFDGQAESAAALAWLFARAERLGVRFEETLCSAASYEARRIARCDANPVVFHSVDYEGVLQVSEGSRLASALRDGVGAAKAYGCGLILIRPAPERVS